jgi:hypothetical protein
MTENMLKLMDQFKQMYWESLRAPSHDEGSMRSPSRRLYLKKKMGKTREERLAFKTKKALDDKEYLEKREAELI